MRHIMLVMGIAGATLAGSMSGPAQAREYPWCARYDWTTQNCGFVSFQQCLATISGIGGRCEPNPFYQAAPPRKRVVR